MITNWQLEQLVFQSGQWYNSVLVQGKRFLDAFDATHGQFPWDDDSSIFLPEKMFLITAIHHAIQHFEKLNEELETRGDMSFYPFLEKIVSKEERSEIKNWRNMNEHEIEYLIGKGRYPGKNISTVEKDGHKFEIGANVTFLNGNVGLFLIGGIKIDKLLLKFKENQSKTLKKLEEIFIAASISDR